MITAYENGNGARVRTLIVDDAPIMRKAIKEILSKDENVDVLAWPSMARTASIKSVAQTRRRDDGYRHAGDERHHGCQKYYGALSDPGPDHQFPGPDGWFAFEALRLGVMDFVPSPRK